MTKGNDFEQPPAVKPEWERPPARLALADGSVFHGRAFGAAGKLVLAEVVFNTAVSGYQESLTDPSYRGQVLVATFPMIGNYGVNAEDVESSRVQVSGFVIRELARRASNYRANMGLDEYLRDQGVLGIAGIDTRAVTRRIRTTGAMAGVLTDRQDLSDGELVEVARGAPSMAGANLVSEVGRDAPCAWGESLGEWGEHAGSPGAEPIGRGLRVLAIDCGAKSNILRNLLSRGCSVELVPASVTADDLLARFDKGQFDGLFVSNGPGDPAAVENVIATLRAVIQDRPGKAGVVPTFGICLGHQLLALAAGARTYKLPFGHRGINQPVLNRLTGEVEITSQNHGFAVDAASLEAVGAEATHVHLNDGTIAGFRLKDRPVFAVQYHPEASPGPHDSGYLFDAFVAMMRTRSPVTAEQMRRLAASATK